MNKKIFSVMLLTSVLLLAGCSWWGGNDEEVVVEPVVNEKSVQPDIHNAVKTSVEVISPDAKEDNDA